MYSYSLNELIWHFAGYLHVIDDIATSRLTYGPAKHTPSTIQLTYSSQELNKTEPDDPIIGRLAAIGDVPVLPSFNRLGGNPADRVTDSLTDRLGNGLGVLPSLDDLYEDIDPPDFEPDVPEIDLPPPPSEFTIFFAYRISGPISHKFDLYSENDLVDNDVVYNAGGLAALPDGQTLDDFLEMAAEAAPDEDFIADLLELAHEQTPDEIKLDDLGSKASVVELAEIFKAGFEKDETPGDEETPGETDETPPAPPSEESSEDDNDGDDAEMAMPDQHIHMGSNEAINVASIVDTSEAGSGFIIHGDYYESNAVVQTNIYSFDNNSAVQSMVGGSDPTSPINIVSNIADLSRETGDAVIPAPIGFSLPEYFASVDYIVGDFFDINLVTQYNDLTDNDALLFETMTSSYWVETGDNTTVNATQILDLYQEYDLLIIQGDYNEINFIKQTNIVLDADNVTFDEAFGGFVNLDGNTLENDATILNIGGGELFQPITDDVQDISDAVQNFDPQIGFTNNEIDFGMPANFGSEINVLFITGDFYQLNAIVQTNILTDIDNGSVTMGDVNDDGVLQTVNAADNVPPADPLYATGDNLASNDATIIDYDSQSEFQYLDGSFYEQDVLIQVDLVTPEDEAMEIAEANNPDALIPEVIAFLGENTSTSSEQQQEIFVPPPVASESDDAMGGMMT